MANVRVRVNQKDGEVRISHAGDEPVVYKVNDGEVSIKEEDVARFLSAVPGSERVGGSPSASKEK